MEPYTLEGLAKRDKDNKKANAVDPGFPKEYYQYKLRGAVVHMGQADSGHYYSYIQDMKSKKWFEFNDTYVSEFDEEEIPEECFGGEESWGSSFMNFRSTYIKTRNAYLLFYERATDYEPPPEEEDAPAEGDAAPQEAAEPSEEDASMKVAEFSIPDDIRAKITLDNQKYWQIRFLFA